MTSFLGNNQSWLDAFLAEGWWVISVMITTMRMTAMATTMRTFLTRMYDEDNNNYNDCNKRPRFFGNNQPWSDEFLAVGGSVISTMTTTMRMATMTTTTTRMMMTMITTTIIQR